MEKESQEILRQRLIELKEELGLIRRLLHDSTEKLKQCKIGFKTISETGNTRVADVFLEELNNEINNL